MFSVNDEGPLPGLAELLPASAEKALNDQTVDEYRRAVAESNLPLSQTMSFGSDFRALIERTLFRKLVRELPEEDARLPWLECHVPPGGTMTISTTTSSVHSSDLELNIFGSGLGTGRKISITATSSSEARKQCATLALDLRVKPRIYEIRGTESVELEVSSILGNSIESKKQCPFCGVPANTIDRFSFQLGEHLDLRHDEVASKRNLKLALEDSKSIDAGIELKNFGVAFKLSATVSRGQTFEIESVFPPGKLYSAYSRLRGGPFQTAMWATELAG